MPIANSGNPVGLEYVSAFFVNSNGFSTGTTLPNAVSNGDVLNSHFMPYARSVGLPAPARVVTQITGGDRWLGSVAFGIGQVDPFQLVLSNVDPTFKAMVTGSSVDITTNARMRRFSNNENKGATPQMGLIISTIYQGRDGLDGVNQWINYIVPRVQISPAPESLNYQSANDSTYNVNATMSTKEPHGLAYADGNMNLAGNKCLLYCSISEYPLFLTTFIGDGATDTFRVAYLPATEIVTVNNTENEMALSGTLTALDSISATNGDAVLASAPAAAAEIGLLYGMALDPTASPTP